MNPFKHFRTRFCQQPFYLKLSLIYDEYILLTINNVHNYPLMVFDRQHYWLIEITYSTFILNFAEVLHPNLSTT